MKSTKKRTMTNLRFPSSLWIILLWLITIIGTGGSCNESHKGTFVQLNVVLGPLIGADVSICPLTNLDLEIARGTTEDATEINKAGRVALEIPQEHREAPLFVHVEGGVDIDADDDGIRDPVPTSNVSTFEFVVPTAADLENMGVVVNPLLLFASRYLLDNLWVASAISEDFEPLSDPEAVRTVQRRIAKALLNEDVNGDNTIGWEDLVSFHPLID